MQLRVKFAEDFDRDEAGSIEQQLLARYGPGYAPPLAWRVRQFFEQWMLPSVLKPEQAASGTLDRYEEMLRYWEAITRDPPLGLLGDEDCSAFANGLPEWGYSRRGVARGGRMRIGRLAEHPAFSPLSSVTIAAHVSRLATLIARAGPQQTLRQRSARILTQLPYVPLVATSKETKVAFTLEEARQIAAACTKMNRPDLPPEWQPWLWWRTRIAIFYFTGLRGGTVVRLAWAHVKDLDGALWLDVPGDIVKTGKPIRVALHAQLSELLQQIPRGSASELILPAGCGYRHFLTLHEELQSQAEIPPGRRQSPHAWRRTHAVQMDRLGASDGREAARRALDHRDARTTTESYVGDAVVNQLRLMLPPLF